jgi:hypothetical protein
VTLTADEMNTLMAEATLGVPPAESRLAPLTEEQREWRARIGRGVAEAVRKGYIIDIPAEFPDISEDNR